MSKNKFTVEIARDRLRVMGMEEDKFGASVIDLSRNPIGLRGWAMIDYLRSNHVRIAVITHKQAEEKNKESFEEIANKRKRVIIKPNNMHCAKYAHGMN